MKANIVASLLYGLVAAAMVYFGYQTVMNLKEPILFIGLLLAVLVVYFITIKALANFAKNLFATLAIIIIFLALSMFAYELILFVSPNCETMSDDDVHCVMPIGQLLFASVLALSVTPLIWKIYRNHRQIKWKLSGKLFGKLVY